MESVSSFASEAADAWGDTVGQNPQTGRGASSPSHPVVTAAGDEKELNLACLSQPAAVASTEDTSNICWSDFHSQGLPTLVETWKMAARFKPGSLKEKVQRSPPAAFEVETRSRASTRIAPQNYEGHSFDLNRHWTVIPADDKTVHGHVYTCPEKSWIITLNN